MNQTVRNILAVLAGIISFIVGIMGLHVLTGLIIEMPPFPAGEADTPENWVAFMQGLSVLQILTALISHIGGTFIGAWVAARISNDGKLIVPLVVAFIAMIGGILNVFQIPGQPLWFILTDISFYLPAGLLAGHLAGRKR
jgi:uncharacterized membrane protein YdcZ (DUF606 family)